MTDLSAEAKRAGFEVTIKHDDETGAARFALSSKPNGIELTTVEELRAWLDGFKAGRKKERREAKKQTALTDVTG